MTGVEVMRLIVASVVLLPACGIFTTERRRRRMRAWVDLLCVAAVMLAFWIAP